MTIVNQGKLMQAKYTSLLVELFVFCFIFSAFTSFSSLELVSLSHSRKHCVLQITVIRNMPTALIHI